MLEAPEINARMLSMARLIIQKGADLSSRDDEGSSACALIFQSNYGIEFLQDFVYQFFDLDTYGNLETADFWLISSIARSVPSFHTKLAAEVRDMRTPPAISSSKATYFDQLLTLEPETQALWLKSSNLRVRAPFMRTICSYGTLKMVQPFIDSGIDLDESDHVDSKSYIRSAARNGNLDIVMSLLDAGANPDQPSWHWKHNNLCTSALDELLERWGFISEERPIEGKSPPDIASELWILPTLLRSRDIRPSTSNALYAGLWFTQKPEPLLPLLQAGLGRRDGQPPGTNHHLSCGSEVIEAVKTQLPYVGLLLEHGLALELEDRFGCTASLYAVDVGSVESLGLLYDAGADLGRRTGYGLTPLELATSNLKADHPRLTQRSWSWAMAERPEISLEQDRIVYEFLVSKLKGKRHTPPLCKSVPWFCGQSFYLSNEVLYGLKDENKFAWRQVALGVVCLLGSMTVLLSRDLWASLFDRYFLHQIRR